jgi:hypothetical protein
MAYCVLGKVSSRFSLSTIARSKKSENHREKKLQCWHIKNIILHPIWSAHDLFRTFAYAVTATTLMEERLFVVSK